MITGQSINVKSKIPLVFVFLCGMIQLVSCEDMLLKSDPPDSPKVVFEQLWNDVMNRYSFLDIKEIDWVAIGNQYRKRVSDEMGERQLFNLLAEMLYELRDGHVNLTSPFDRSRNWEWYQNYPDNYNQNIIERNYLKRDHLITGPLRNQVINSILYVNYRSFGDKISVDHIEQLMQRAEGMKGVIIDIRHNGGGSLQNGYLLASCFVEEPVIFARQRFKAGPDKDDFTPWEDLKVTPRKGKRYNGPVVLLTNRRSYSASTFFAQMMREMPNAIVIGDDTGGGGGVPLFGELSNGWTYRFSATQTITPEGSHIEFTVPVNIRVDMDPALELQGIDSILEYALDYLISK